MPVGVGGSGGRRACRAPSDDGEDDRFVPGEEIRERLHVRSLSEGLGGLADVDRGAAPGGWGPARYHRIGDAPGTLGIISPLSGHVCGACNRLRLTADGRLRTCLFDDEEIDVRPALGSGSDEDVRSLIRTALERKPAGIEARLPRGTRRSMHQIGG
jgi:cyclic pyranopterin phosphate synthase